LPIRLLWVGFWVFESLYSQEETSRGRKMLGCHTLFGHERGEEIREYIESVVDGPCPCRTGRRCPLTGKTDAAPPPAGAREAATPA
jgi:hypothetical protein